MLVSVHKPCAPSSPSTYGRQFSAPSCCPKVSQPHHGIVRRAEFYLKVRRADDSRRPVLIPVEQVHELAADAEYGAIDLAIDEKQHPGRRVNMIGKFPPVATRRRSETELPLPRFCRSRLCGARGRVQ